MGEAPPHIHTATNTARTTTNTQPHAATESRAVGRYKLGCEWLAGWLAEEAGLTRLCPRRCRHTIYQLTVKMVR